eukprot:scaffold137184_cov45-Attheya_sp.AAC.1
MKKETQSVDFHAYARHCQCHRNYHRALCSDHVRNNDWERISIAVGDIGCGWLVAVAEPWGVVVGVEGVMVSL